MSTLVFPDKQCIHVSEICYKIIYQTGMDECPQETYHICENCSKLRGFCNDDTIISKEILN